MRGRLALLALAGAGAGAGEGDLGLGAGAGICRGGESEGLVEEMCECHRYKLCPGHLAGLGGAGAGAGAGEGLLLSSDMEREGFRDGGVTFLGGGLLYSNLMASLILALLEAVDARDMDLVF